MRKVEEEKDEIKTLKRKHGNNIKVYRKVLTFLDARKLCCNLPKIQEKRPNLWVFSQKDANGIANSVDPDQTALFAQTCLSKNLGSLQHYGFMKKYVFGISNQLRHTPGC